MNLVLRSEQNGSVLRLTLNDPHSRNSLSDAMLASLSKALADAENDQSVSVIVIAADGPAFCSGHNLKELTARRSDSDGGAAYFESIFTRCANLMVQTAQHRCAIMAEVAGLASAAGCQLVATCDLAYASQNAKFCTPGVNIGLFCSTPMTALSRSVAHKHAMEMLLTGDVFDAEYAHRVGLVNAVLAPEELSIYVAGIAEKISLKSATAIRYGKKLFHAQQDQPLAEAYKTCSQVMVKNMLDADANEGISAFLEKRRPHWRSNSHS
jgi:enoyl-CoA hydratase/carnithine racemase